MDAKYRYPDTFTLSSVGNEPLADTGIPQYAEYEENKNEENAQPSYLEKILSMTTPVNKLEETLQGTHIETKKVGVGTGEGDEKSEKNEKNDEGEKENKEEEDDDELLDHSDLVKNAKFRWQISKDYGNFEVNMFLTISDVQLRKYRALKNGGLFAGRTQFRFRAGKMDLRKRFQISTIVKYLAVK